MTPKVDPAERLLNLVIALSHAKQPMSKQQIRTKVVGYANTKSDASFNRMFERDKKDLRELGIPLISQTGSVHEDEHSYRIDVTQYQLPEISLAPAQMSVLTLAANMWQGAVIADLSRHALTKLQAVAPRADAQALQGVALAYAGPDAQLLEMLEAATNRQVVEFTYRSAHSGGMGTRRVQPWRIYSQDGGWYLLGWDADRQDRRTFRLSRIIGDVRIASKEQAFSVPQELPQSAPRPAKRARLLLRTQAAWSLRRRADWIATEVTTGWDEVLLTYSEASIFADELAELGPAVKVVEPQQLRGQVLSRIQAGASLTSKVAAISETAQPQSVTAPAPARKELATSRLVRLLAIVSYLEDAGPVPVAELAEHFNVSPGQIVRDIDTLWVSGTPGYGPEDLIDFSADRYDQGVVELLDSRRMDKPVRLSNGEAVALLVALHALSAQAGVVGDELINSTIQALQNAIDYDGEALTTVLARPSGQAADPHGITATIRQALQSGKQLQLEYISAIDERTQRVVDPWRLYTDGKATYLNAWCHKVQQERNFRIDRIQGLGILDSPVNTSPVAAQADGVAGTEADGSEAITIAHLTIKGKGRFLADRHAVHVLAEHDDGSLTIRIEAFSQRWLAALLLAHAPLIEQIEPHEVAQHVEELAAATLALYEPELGMP